MPLPGKPPSILTLHDSVCQLQDRSAWRVSLVLMNTATASAPGQTTSTRQLTEEELYRFDLEGYLVVPDALGEDQLALLNQVFDVKATALDAEKPEHIWTGSVDEHSLLHWHQAFRDLVDNPRILPFLYAFVSEEVRLDHDYAALVGAGRRTGGGVLHGGNAPFDACFLYAHRDGRIRSGLTVVAYNLREVKPGDGGFACVPGSHKSNYALPAAWHNLDHPPGCVRAVPAPAGSAVIFTEALTHGTMPWRGSGERRTLFYKYSPPSISWSARYYDAGRFPQLSARQRAMLEPPNARYGHRPQPPGP